MAHEWVILANLLGLLLGFALLSNHFERSKVPEVLPHFLPTTGKAASCSATVFLLALVACASMMPVEKLPAASWQSTLSLGFLSALFDNIPLTALALKQGDYDWGMLAYVPAAA